MKSSQARKEFTEFLSTMDSDYVFIHSDIFRANKYVEHSTVPNEILNKHIKFLLEVFDGKNVLFPAFNYQFSKTRIYDVNNCKCEVGPLPEYFRFNVSNWRSFDPMFSVSGLGENPFKMQEGEISAYSNGSIFQKLTDNNAYILFYGAPFASLTIIHYAEYLATPIYRYDKTITGHILFNGARFEINYTFHARPKNMYLEYCWDDLYKDLINQGIIFTTSDNLVHILRSDHLVNYLVSKLNKDPFFLLDKKSKDWVIPKFNQIKRRFLIKDYE